MSIDKVRAAEKAVVVAAMKLLECRIEGWNTEPDRVRDVIRRAFYLGQVSHERDVYRREMPRPKKRREREAGRR